MKRGPIWVFSLALFPMGLGVFALGLGDVRDGYRSRSWSQAPGKVLSSRLVRNFPAPPKPEVRYTYTFEGKPYVSNRLWPGGILAIMPVMSGEAARELVSTYPENAEVAVYVNPSRPSEAALIPGPRKGYRWMAVFSAFLVLAFWAPLSMGRLFARIASMRKEPRSHDH